MVTIPLARDNLPGLVRNLTSNANKQIRKKIINGKGAVRTGKRFTLFVSNEDMNDIIKVIKSLKDSGVLIDGVTETVKHKIKKTRRRISWSFVSTFSRFISATRLVQPVLSSIVKGINGKGFRRPGTGHLDKNVCFQSIL